ncbi:glutathione transferase GstA [Nitrincola alkalilacustris]|uniref:glutathione transferase GstA n=1 Tax=Nitrincola alkalilacustris TaxID=1571224 RepID=UPI00124C4D0E|nr:glutathione transferase GstA [Nitrincola alkalilacustris]
MKLFYKTGACSLATHIVLREVEAEFTLIQVDTERQQTEFGADYRTVNPKGYVPALQLESGVILTEGAAILQYIADLNPANQLSPAQAGIARARLQEYLNYVSSELHKAFAPLFRGNATATQKDDAVKAVAAKFDYVESLFADGRSFLLGENFSVADAYLFVVVNWTNFTGIELKPWPMLEAFFHRVLARPSVRSAFAAEGLDT